MSDTKISNCPTNTVSKISFSEVGDVFSASSWDSSIRIYQHDASGNVQPLAMQSQNGPILANDWQPQSPVVAYGGKEGLVSVFDMRSQQSAAMGKHDDTISAMKFCNDTTLATCSWDRTLRFWDLRNSSSLGTVQLPERAYCMDGSPNKLLIASADRHLCFVDVAQNPLAIAQQFYSPMKWQTSCIAVNSAGSEWAVGSIEGRAAVEYINPQDSSKAIKFKAHVGTGTALKPVSVICFHPVVNSLFTAGGDMKYVFWDLNVRRKVKTVPTDKPVTAASFNKAGNILTYATGTVNEQVSGGDIFIRPVQVSDVQSNS